GGRALFFLRPGTSRLSGRVLPLEVEFGSEICQEDFMMTKSGIKIFFYLIGLFLLMGRNASALDSKTESIMDGILGHYLIIQEKLASDTTAGVEGEAQKIVQKTDEFFNKPCRPDEIGCASLIQKMRTAASRMKGSDIKVLRENFLVVSQSLENYWKEYNPRWQ